MLRKILSLQLGMSPSVKRKLHINNECPTPTKKKKKDDMSVESWVSLQAPANSMGKQKIASLNSIGIAVFRSI